MVTAYENILGMDVSVCLCVCVCVRVFSDQKSAQHEEADEVHDCKVAATAELLPRFVVRLRVTAFSRQTGQHDLLPRLTRRTPALIHTRTCTHTHRIVLMDSEC